MQHMIRIDACTAAISLSFESRTTHVIRVLRCEAAKLTRRVHK